MIEQIGIGLVAMLLGLPLLVALVGRQRGWPVDRAREWGIVAGCLGGAVLAPSPWALLPLLVGVAGAVRPAWPGTIIAGVTPLLALGGLILAPDHRLAQERQNYALMERGGGKAVFAANRSDLRNATSLMESAFADGHRFDAVLLADDEYQYWGSATLAFAPEESTYHAWVWRDNIMAAVTVPCDLDFSNGEPICPAALPVPTPGAAPRRFGPEWVQDSSVDVPWLDRLRSVRPGAFATDTLLQRMRVRTTVEATGWRAERDAFNWTCFTGSGALAPAGVEPGGVICRARATELKVDDGGHVH